MIKLSLYVHETGWFFCVAGKILKPSVVALAIAFFASGCVAPAPLYTQTTRGLNDIDTYYIAEIDAMRQQLQRENSIFLAQIEYQQRLIRSLEQQIRGMKSQRAEAVSFNQIQSASVPDSSSESLAWVKPVVWQVALATAWDALKGILGRRP